MLSLHSTFIISLSKHPTKKSGKRFWAKKCISDIHDSKRKRVLLIGILHTDIHICLILLLIFLVWTEKKKKKKEKDGSFIQILVVLLSHLLNIIVITTANLTWIPSYPNPTGPLSFFLNLSAEQQSKWEKW